MKTKKEIEKEFREDLRLLLKKYNAEMSIEYDMKGWNQREGATISAEISGIYNEDGETLQDFVSIDLGSFIS